MKKITGLFLTLTLAFSLFPYQAFAAVGDSVTLASNENYPCAKSDAEVTCSDINEMLTEGALERGIPPEVAKAVAFAESTWKQWVDEDQTEPNIQDDGGIGIMQVTDGGYDVGKLKNDIQYNINVGLDILNDKWNLGVRGVIPTVNDNSKDTIEHWYFAVLAYNGVKEVNSPIKREDGEVNESAYQEKVFGVIEEYNNGLELKTLPLEKDDFTYDPNDKDTTLNFNKMLYQVPAPLTASRQMYKAEDKALTIEGTMLRDTKNGQGGEKLEQREVVDIKDATIYYDTSDQSPGRHWVRYHVKLEDGREGFVASGAIEPVTSRLKGETRIETAIDISEKGWQNGADTVVLAKAFDFPDALAGAPLAYKYDAPILLTRTGSLNPSTKEEIERLHADRVIILGSVGAVSKDVEDELTAMNLDDVTRIGGKDRYETAQMIADKLGSDKGEVVLTTGLNYPDALAVAPYAARQGLPILLTRPQSAPAATKDALKDQSQVYVIGGDDVVSDAVLEEFNGRVDRISGPTRFETAADIIDTFDLGNQQALVATGYNYADALTGSVLAAKKNAPLLLVRENNIPAAMERTISTRQIHNYILLGGSDVVDVADPLAELAENMMQ
ncbi:cell wall-binding repeat-containing protein [Halobacillus sp. HZG1]|uniref:cell wall-binding repeat-containing protein n=1 Tax=Halobacillus sp. HZG1 TaxID=3111769 RepID=UPI002DBD9A3C|nr:cell wall-binding repeat-containing protein [Halobacillus sp. HZG1]MEC3884253.1 cell wall-binding repeat-containing protein [Halobacillus sp. HZG1]